MVANHPLKVTRKGTLFPGIKAAARALKINRVTLYRILKGQYPDRRGWKTKYEKWVRSHFAR